MLSITFTNFGPHTSFQLGKSRYFSGVFSPPPLVFAADQNPPTERIFWEYDRDDWSSVRYF